MKGSSERILILGSYKAWALSATASAILERVSGVDSCQSTLEQVLIRLHSFIS